MVFGLLGHQVCMETKQLKITNLLSYINRWLHTHTHIKGGNQKLKKKQIKK
jgi:hypothetical protein